MRSQIREKLRSGTLSMGTWIASGSPVVTELAALCGLDWLLLDMEHGSFREDSVFSCLQAASAGTRTAIVVRVPAHDASLIGRVLDMGADAVMVPHVDTAVQAEAIAAAMRHPPLGSRGYSRSVRAFRYGLGDTEEAQPPLLFAQIESVEGLANAEAIASVDGVDCLFIGPADLKRSLAASGSTLDYTEQLRRINTLAAAHGRQTGILVRDYAETRGLLAAGFTKVAIDSDLSLLRSGFVHIAAHSAQ